MTPNNLNNKPYHDFKEKLDKEQIDSKALEVVFAEMGFKFKANTDTELQKLGVDYLLKNETKKLTADIKLQYQPYNHLTEILLEVDNIWSNSNKRFKKGWAVDEALITDLLVDFLVERKEFNLKQRQMDALPGYCFVYDAKQVKEWATKNLANLNNIPDGCYVRKTPNRNMYTVNVIVPRKYLKDFLVHSAIVKEGQVIL
jgi:hypothetical protein